VLVVATCWVGGLAAAGPAESERPPCGVLVILVASCGCHIYAPACSCNLATLACIGAGRIEAAVGAGFCMPLAAFESVVFGRLQFHGSSCGSERHGAFSGIMAGAVQDGTGGELLSSTADWACLPACSYVLFLYVAREGSRHGLSRPLSSAFGAWLETRLLPPGLPPPRDAGAEEAAAAAAQVAAPCGGVVIGHVGGSIPCVVVPCELSFPYSRSEALARTTPFDIADVGVAAGAMRLRGGAIDGPVDDPAVDDPLDRQAAHPPHLLRTELGDVLMVRTRGIHMDIHLQSRAWQRETVPAEVSFVLAGPPTRSDAPPTWLEQELAQLQADRALMESLTGQPEYGYMQREAWLRRVDASRQQAVAEAAAEFASLPLTERERHEAEMARMVELFQVSSLRSPEEMPEDEAALDYEELEAALYQAQAACDESAVQRLMALLAGDDSGERAAQVRSPEDAACARERADFEAAEWDREERRQEATAAAVAFHFLEGSWSDARYAGEVAALEIEAPEVAVGDW
jgi:hypothetical protein